MRRKTPPGSGSRKGRIARPGPDLVEHAFAPEDSGRPVLGDLLGGEDDRDLRRGDRTDQSVVLGHLGRFGELDVVDDLPGAALGQPEDQIAVEAGAAAASASGARRRWRRRCRRRRCPRAAPRCPGPRSGRPPGRARGAPRDRAPRRRWRAPRPPPRSPGAGSARVRHAWRRGWDSSTGLPGPAATDDLLSNARRSVTSTAKRSSEYKSAGFYGLCASGGGVAFEPGIQLFVPA